MNENLICKVEQISRLRNNSLVIGRANSPYHVICYFLVFKLRNFHKKTGVQNMYVYIRFEWYILGIIFIKIYNREYGGNTATDISLHTVTK